MYNAEIGRLSLKSGGGSFTLKSGELETLRRYRVSGISIENIASVVFYIVTSLLIHQSNLNKDSIFAYCVITD